MNHCQNIGQIDMDHITHATCPTFLQRLVKVNITTNSNDRRSYAILILMIKKHDTKLKNAHSNKMEMVMGNIQ